ncbi:MAG: Pr6Pr family membrane protein [Sphingomonas sp.]|nr:Pr6Pr family membrane protein [Sphingomonas sp.]
MIRKIAAVTAIAGWAVLLLRLWLMVPEMGIAGGLWRFVGFFTILTNIAVAVVATAMAVGREGWLTSARVRLAMAVGIAFVGIAYWVLLASLWDPQGWVLVADVGLHTTQPLFFVATWFAARDGSLGVRDAAWAMAWPIGYCAYALARGAVDGWYAYWFLNPIEQGWPGALASIAGLSAAFFLLALLFVALDRRVRV